MSRRPPRTSYGYLAPPGARVSGWRCCQEDCGRGDELAPRSWPALCPECRRPVDPSFAEPWAHEARGVELRHNLGSNDPYKRGHAEIELHVWAYKDAWLRDDRTAAQAAWLSFQEVRRRKGLKEFWVSTAAANIVGLAAEFDDLDRAAHEILELHPSIETRDLESDGNSDDRTIARQFVSMCIDVLERESSIDHPCEGALFAAMRDVAKRADTVLTSDHSRGFQRIGELRALHRSRASIALTRRSLATIYDDLPAFSTLPPGKRGTADPPADVIGSLGARVSVTLSLADAAVEAAQIHDDTGPLDLVIRQTELIGTMPGFVHLLRARRSLISGELREAVSQLESGLEATDALGLRLRPQTLAMRGLLGARIDPRTLDEGVRLCELGRQHGLRRWRRVTAADIGLARLLLWRAGRPEEPTAQQASDIRRAVRLARRRCRPWRRWGVDDRLLLQESLAAREMLSGQGDVSRRHRAWRRLAEAPWSTAAKARVAAAWAQWAVGTGVAELAAEAYQCLVDLVARDSAARYAPGAKQRVLATAQEYAEEAGYWLARTGRYREAVVALEIGRAIGLTEVLGRDQASVSERLREAGRADLADAYRRAIAEFDERQRGSSPRLRQAWETLRHVAREVGAATGADPLALDVRYEDITAETGEGALVYIAAAKAGGYALVVAAGHDPQFLDLPKLDRATVAALAGSMLPGVTAWSRSTDRNSIAGGSEPATRDAWPGRRAGDPVQEGLEELWRGGFRDLLLNSARGQIVTLVPVGLLSLLPLHAAGEPGTPGDRYTEWRHAGHFSAIRYAPNARGLRRCRETANALTPSEHSLVAVDVPNGFGLAAAARLRFVARETEEVARRWTGLPTRLMHGCTWEQFRATADECSVWHLACHGRADPGSILDSRLFFADRQVSLRELRRELRPDRRRLAILSACETNLTDATVPNEVVGIPSALIQVGFAGVVAAAWSVDDLATTYLMTAFYQLWRGQDRQPAVALNAAQRWLRSATRSDLAALIPDVEPRGDPGEYPYLNPRYWAAFAYTGA